MKVPAALTRRNPSHKRAPKWCRGEWQLPGSLALLVVASVAACVDPDPGVRDAWTSHDDSLVRIHYGPSINVSVDQAQYLKTVVWRRVVVPGLPPFLLQGQRIQVNLVARQDRGVDALTFRQSKTVVLPADEIFKWDSVRLDRVVRHEIAHVALGVFFDGASLPAWLEEGFAEWVAGGLDCVGEARVRLDVVTRARMGLPPYQLAGTATEGETRLGYDMSGTFFAYLEARRSNVVAGGFLLASIRDRGINAGVQAVMGVALEEVEVGWQRYMAANFGTIPQDYSCT